MMAVSPAHTAQPTKIHGALPQNPGIEGSGGVIEVLVTLQ